MAALTNKGSLLHVWKICFQHVSFKSTIFRWCICHCCWEELLGYEWYVYKWGLIL